MEVVASGRDMSSRWTAFAIESTGGNYAMEWAFDTTDGPVQVGASVYDGEDAYLGGLHVDVVHQ